MTDAVEQEQERCRQRALSLGLREYVRREDLYREAAQLCTALFWHPRWKVDNERIRPILERAEKRRERRHHYAWN